MKLIFFLSFCLLATTTPQVHLVSAEEPIRIGGLIVLTGQYAMQGNAFREGAELAIEEINQRGGVVGRKLELRAEDTGNLPVRALTAARKLITLDKVVAAISTSYPELATGAAEFQKNNIPVVHLWDSSPDIESMGEYIFAIGPWTPSSGEVAARFARKRLELKKATIIATNDPWAELVTRYFVDEFRKNGGEIVQSLSVDPQETDFRSVFTKVRAQKPGVLFTPITDNIVAFYTQLRQSQLSIPVISSDVVSDEHIQQAPKVFEGLYIALMKDPAGASVSQLATSYKKKFGRPLTLPWFVATAYDGINIIAACIQDNGPDSVAMKTCIGNTRNKVGITQTFTFTPGGSAPQHQSIFVIRNKKIEFHWDDP